jgi:hypothetical protein
MNLTTMPSYGALLAVKYASRLLYDIQEEWVGEVPDDPWEGVRVIAVLHHTSLAEGVYLPLVPNRVLKAMARHAVLPVAQETMAQPVEGRIFRVLIPNAVAITRRRDRSWSRVLEEIDDPGSMVALFPEGRMMRPDGRDKKGEPMTVKSGIAEVLRSIGPGRMILAYSGGLHHVFPPGARRPRFFQRLRIRIESLDIETYVNDRLADGGSFADRVVEDLTRRRDLYTPIAPGTPSPVRAEVRRRRRQCLRRHGGDGRTAIDGIVAGNGAKRRRERRAQGRATPRSNLDRSLSGPL